MKKIFFLILTTALLSGCQTYYAQQQQAQMQQRENSLLAQEQRQQTGGRIEGLEMEIARLSRDLDQQRTANEARFAAVERQAETDKQQMISRLTAELERLLGQMKTPAPAPDAPSGRTQYGIEHTVRPGETLSTIAAAYGVSVKKLIGVNKLKNPDRVSIGQKIFIPE